jgi:putative ABC transport system ATP-binding protein
MIGRLARPTSVRILLHRRNLTGLPELFLTAVRRETFGFTFRRFNLIQGFSVLANVMLPAYPLAAGHGELVARARALLAQLGLKDKDAAREECLSGG